MNKGTRFTINSNGNELVGYATKPEKEGKFPTVIVSHGFSSNTDRTVTYAQIFAEKGYATFIFDFTMTGTGESGGDCHGVSAITEKEDLITVLNYVRSIDYVDTEHILLAGCSLGGFVSALAGPEVEQDIQGLVLFYPAFCVPEHLREGRVQASTFDIHNLPEEIITPRMTIGKKFITDCINMDAYECTRNFHKPVLIIHGLEDALVDIDFARQAAKQYPNCQLAEIHGDHGFKIPEAFKECTEIVNNWLQK